MAMKLVRTKVKVFRLSPAEAGRLAGIVERWVRDQPKLLWSERITETKVVVTLIDREFNRLEEEGKAKRLERQKKKGGKIKVTGNSGMSISK